MNGAKVKFSITWKQFFRPKTMHNKQQKTSKKSRNKERSIYMGKNRFEDDTSTIEFIGYNFRQAKRLPSSVLWNTSRLSDTLSSLTRCEFDYAELSPTKAFQKPSQTKGWRLSFRLSARITCLVRFIYTFCEIELSIKIDTSYLNMFPFKFQQNILLYRVISMEWFLTNLPKVE